MLTIADARLQTSKIDVTQFWNEIVELRPSLERDLPRLHHLLELSDLARDARAELIRRTGARNGAEFRDPPRNLGHGDRRDRGRAVLGQAAALLINHIAPGRRTLAPSA